MNPGWWRFDYLKAIELSGDRSLRTPRVIHCYTTGYDGITRSLCGNQRITPETAKPLYPQSRGRGPCPKCEKRARSSRAGAFVAASRWREDGAGLDWYLNYRSPANRAPASSAAPTLPVSSAANRATGSRRPVSSAGAKQGKSSSSAAAKVGTRSRAHFAGKQGTSSRSRPVKTSKKRRAR